MARPAAEKFVLPDGREVGYGLNDRNGVYRVRFTGPEGNRVETSTGCSTRADAYLSAAKIVLKTFAPTLPPDPRKASWDDALATLPPDMRDKSAETYRSTIRILREEMPDLNGPNDVTPEVARTFRIKYGKGTFARSNKSDAKRYPRSAKTVENAIRRLSGFWGHLKEAGLTTANPWAGVPRPTVPKKLTTVPDEDVVDEFMAYVDQRYPDWPLPRVFVTVKALAGCRTSDLCQVRSSQLRNGNLVITHDQDKTHRERTIPLPADVFDALNKMKGPTFLWESYTEGAKVYRAGTRNLDVFKPKTLFWCINNLFREFNEGRPGLPKLLPHAFRRRAITRMVTVTQSVDQTAAAIGIDPATARRYYLDSKQAFDGAELMKRMADVLRPGVTK